MNIAVISGLDVFGGGGFQQELSTILILNKHKSSIYNFIFFVNNKDKLNILKKKNVDAYLLPYNLWDSGIAYLKSNKLFYKIFEKFGHANKFDKILDSFNIDLVYFLSSSFLSLRTEKYNYIITVWDLCHREHMEFPEVYANREFENRENFFKNALIKAVSVIADSEIGKQNIIRRYNVEESRVVSLPHLPSTSVDISDEEYHKNYIDVKKKYGLNGDYIFYPAQFWSHKNHIYILEGLDILKNKYKILINALFCGSDKGNLNFILNKIKEIRMEDHIHYIGFVNNEEIPYLYRQALALVMPTYFGPSNLPPMEAFRLGCPVIYSDLPDLREQVKDAAFLLNLNDPSDLALKIIKVINDRDEVKQKIANGRKILEKWTEEDYWIGVKKILDEYAIKQKCFK